LRSVLRGVLSLNKGYSFRRATERAVDSFADLRWGPDRSGFRRLLHPNGICLTGLWEITEDSIYSGYFSQGSQALILGRYSTCCSKTRRGQSRSLSLVGKLYPTTNADETRFLHPAHFITQEDIGGDTTGYINDAQLLNAPNTTVWRRGLGFLILLITGAVFNLVDKKPTIRQLYQIAELGQNDKVTTRTPTFMRLLVTPGQPKIEGQQLDFRDEIMAQMYDRGDPAPRRVLTFDIEVTDEGKTHGLPIIQGVASHRQNHVR
jgi:hypothetical protein